MNLQTIDYIILGLVLISTGFGLFRGIVRQIGDVAGLIIGIVGANIWGGQLSLWLQENAKLEVIYSTLIAYIGLFLIIYLIVRIIALFIRALTKLVRLGWIDSIAGGIFGGFKMVLFISIAINLAILIAPKAEWWKEKQYTESMCIQKIQPVAPHILHMVRGDAQPSK